MIMRSEGAHLGEVQPKGALSWIVHRLLASRKIQDGSCLLLDANTSVGMTLVSPVTELPTMAPGEASK